MTRGVVTAWTGTDTAWAGTDTALLQLLSWALAPALQSSQDPGTDQSELSQTHISPHIITQGRQWAQPSSSCSPSPHSCLIHSSASLLFWKPSTPITQRKAGFKQSPCPGTLCYLESTSVLEFPFFPVPAALEEVLPAPSLAQQRSRNFPLHQCPKSCPGTPRQGSGAGWGEANVSTETLWDPRAPHKTLDILPPGEAQPAALHTP